MEPPADDTEDSKDSVTTPPPPKVQQSPPPNAAVVSSSSAPGTSRKVQPVLPNIAYLESFPPGYRFRPYDRELVDFYLFRKVHSLPLPQTKIMDVNIYQHNPETLAERYKMYGEKEWFFFTPRSKKYKNGTRPNRAAGDGFWKATGADRPVMHSGKLVGYKKALVFFLGRPPKGDKTNWIMHEYRIKDPPPIRKDDSNDMMLDEWVLCKLYKKPERSRVSSVTVEEQASMILQKDDGPPDQTADTPVTYPPYTPDQTADTPLTTYPLYTPNQMVDAPITYHPPIENHTQYEQFPFSEHLPNNLSTLNVVQPLRTMPVESSQSNYGIFENPQQMDPVFGPPALDMDYLNFGAYMDSRFPEMDWPDLDFQHDHDASWFDENIQNNTKP